MIPPPFWGQTDLQDARNQAEELFRSSRYTEPPETYLALFDEYRSVKGRLGIGDANTPVN